MNNPEYPKTNKPYYIAGAINEITPKDHTLNPPSMENNPNNNTEFFIKKAEGHFIRDVKQNLEGEDNSGFVNESAPTVRDGYINGSEDKVKVPVFSGSTTNVNQRNDPTTAEMLKSGTLSHYLEDSTHSKDELHNYMKPPVSPLQPFTRVNDIKNPYIADELIFKTYNRTKLPIADIEWRKGFRHIFITRPECYLMYKENGIPYLCDQAMRDEDFSSAYSRMPHIIKLLSPWYISGTTPTSQTSDGPNESNWNFLLSNRIQGLSVGASVLSTYDSTSKSSQGFTVTIGQHLESRFGGTIDVTFNDTKRLEIFEYMRLWMLYIYKRKLGIFVPPYNGYAKENAFTDVDKLSLRAHYTRFHPYDRAIEYPASMYDIITNETGTKILYWCKYYGIFPKQVMPALTNNENQPISSATTNVTFQYQYRLENTNKTLVEFNHDSGLTDDIGRIQADHVTNSMPFLLKDYDFDKVMPRYIGAAGMFVGSPYIVMAISQQPDPLNRDNKIITPNLRFLGLPGSELDGKGNLGIQNATPKVPTNNVIAYD